MKKQLQEKMARLAVELRAIVNTAKNDGDRGLTADETTKFHNLEAEYAQVEASIKAVDRVDEIERDLTTVPKDKIAAKLGEDVYGAEAEKENRSLHNKAFSKYLRHGISALDVEEKRFMQMNFRGTQPLDVKNAQTLTTTGGGYLIPTGFSDQLEEALKWYGGIMGNVGEFTTETGQPIPWPSVNETTQKGRILGINTQLTETDMVFGQPVTFNAYIFTSDSVLVPLALIEDSYFNLDAFIAKALGTRLGRAMNYQFTVGTGGGVAPTGIVPAAVAGGNSIQGAVGETTTVSYNDLVNLMHAVDPAYRMMPSAKYMFSDAVLKIIRLLKDTAGRPLWQPGISAGFGNGFPDTILDKPYVINQDMATPAANAYSMLFGDLSSYKVRRVASGTTVMRLVERYADYLQVGFLAFLRADGNQVDAGTHPIATFQQSAT